MAARQRIVVLAAVAAIALAGSAGWPGSATAADAAAGPGGAAVIAGSGGPGTAAFTPDGTRWHLGAARAPRPEAAGIRC